MSESTNKINSEREYLTYGDIVWGQFKKNSLAMYALFGLFLLVFLAIFCPMFASDRPFIWTENGEITYPWFSSLFDRNYYESSIDIFFNLAMVFTIPYIVIWKFASKFLQTQYPTKREYRKSIFYLNLSLFFLLILSFLGMSFVDYKEPYRQFYEDREQAVSAQKRAETDIQNPDKSLKSHIKTPSGQFLLRKDSVVFLQDIPAQGIKKGQSGSISDLQSGVSLQISATVPLSKDEIQKNKKEGKKEKSKTVRIKLSAEEAAQKIKLSEISATFAPIPYGYRKTGFKSLEGPSSKHWLGIDQSTRDVSVRMLYGTRIALSIGIIAVSIYITIGVIIGSIAGFFGGWVDILVVRFIEIFMSIPSLFVILALLAIIEKPSIFHIMAVIGLLRWTGVARLTRGEFLRLRNLDFVSSAIALGYPTHRIIFQHILPNALGPVLVNATFGVAAAILTESTLSFLGLGDISVPSWGQTLNEGYSTGAWHIILAPGFAIFVTVSLLNLVGEGVRDALDPKMRK